MVLMKIMKCIKEYFSGECVEPKTQDEIVEQLKNVSEPTYMLAKAIDDGVVKTYTIPTYNDAYYCQDIIQYAYSRLSYRLYSIPTNNPSTFPFSIGDLFI